MKQAFAGILAGILLLFSLSGCAKKEGRRVYTQTFFEGFDTVSTLRAYADSQADFDRLADLFLDRLAYWNRLFDIYHDYEGISNLKTVNDRAGQAVKVDGEILSLLEFGREIHSITGGMTNIAMGSVLTLWHDCRESAKEHPESAHTPDPAALIAAAEHTDLSKMEIDRAASTVRLADPKMRLDVGAIAKGYAAGKIANALREAGMSDGTVNVGGNTVTVGRRPDGPWRVGIQNPDPDGDFLSVLGLSDLCLVTSGSYERYFEVGGVRYHHIIHPDTLYPVNLYLSVSVLSADSALCDGLSTALFNMEPDAGMALVESLDGVEALWMNADGSLTRSSGFAAYEEDPDEEV